jgi:hypothetical protein
MRDRPRRPTKAKRKAKARQRKRPPTVAPLLTFADLVLDPGIESLLARHLQDGAAPEHVHAAARAILGSVGVRARDVLVAGLGPVDHLDELAAQLAVIGHGKRPEAAPALLILVARALGFHRDRLAAWARDPVKHAARLAMVRWEATLRWVRAAAKVRAVLEKRRARMSG